MTIKEFDHLENGAIVDIYHLKNLIFKFDMFYQGIHRVLLSSSDGEWGYLIDYEVFLKDGKAI
jgi:hypothetical protein